jgi:hypothetical protein
VDIKPRRMLVLENSSTLTREEKELRKAYINIVSNLTEFTLTVVPYFDPFSAKYSGIESVQYNKHDYQVLLEVTSYFGSSKGGRGRLLEKVIAFESGPNAASGKSLAQIPKLLESRRDVKERSQWQLADNAPKIKFDLVNIIDNRIVLLEIKNRVDSGGTAARREVLTNKFFKLSKIILDGKKVFVKDNNTTMDFAQTLLEHGINEVEMHLGLLFDIDGYEATIESDRDDGYYGESRGLLTDYHQEQDHRFSENLKYDESLQRLSFEKDGLAVSIDVLYGSNVTKAFTKDHLTLDTTLKNVFTRNWDDIWLTLTTAISQRVLLFKYHTNHIMQIKNIKETESPSSDFGTCFRRFVANQEDMESLSECVRIVREKANISKLPIPSSSVADSLDLQLADCIYVYAAYTSHKKVRSTPLKGLADQ